MIAILACGDVGVKRTDPASMFKHCAKTMRAADLCFAQLETTMSERGAKVPNARLAMRSPCSMAAAVRDAGIGVMSFAGNHCLDFGYDAFRDTLQTAAGARIALCGAGMTLAQARRPALLTCSGVRIAILAASSILPEGYAAEVNKPGCVPLRAHTLYQPLEPDQPGTPARIRTFADRADLEALLESIRQSRRAADVVLLSMHWGIHMVRAAIADYQIEVAHAAIDAGADAVLGHHPHLLKGIEFHRGRPIFYSLGNFAIEQPHIWDPAITQTDSFRHLMSLNPAWTLDQTYMLPAITRPSGLAKLVREDDGRWRVGFLPAWINDDSSPEMLEAADSRFAEVAALLTESSREAGLGADLSVDGNELALRAPVQPTRR